MTHLREDLFEGGYLTIDPETGKSKPTQKGFELIKNSTRINLEFWVNHKEDIGKTLSEEKWEEFLRFYDWDEEEEVEIIKNKKIKVKNFRLKEEQ